MCDNPACTILQRCEACQQRFNENKTPSATVSSWANVLNKTTKVIIPQNSMSLQSEPFAPDPKVGVYFPIAHTRPRHSTAQCLNTFRKQVDCDDANLKSKIVKFLEADMIYDYKKPTTREAKALQNLKNSLLMAGDYLLQNKSVAYNYVPELSAKHGWVRRFCPFVVVKLNNRWTLKQSYYIMWHRVWITPNLKALLNYLLRNIGRICARDKVHVHQKYLLHLYLGYNAYKHASFNDTKATIKSMSLILANMVISLLYQTGLFVKHQVILAFENKYTYRRKKENWPFANFFRYTRRHQSLGIF
jgi:hypothetical protein